MLLDHMAGRNRNFLVAAGVAILNERDDAEVRKIEVESEVINGRPTHNYQLFKGVASPINSNLGAPRTSRPTRVARQGYTRERPLRMPGIAN
ncbi:predicted protein [Histoplasma mississippiense (nom. inval.)]|uniref:predicted protein n=1 Tax=Ajellomyces capsulatus (strain NAm1 / WU24) TaxID=2059318 RepID=UPI000157B2DD|nr:predicted protein [Histoplasma mississippiense (nom. inval.)]EDN02147.1 predicted protein [Histoplasma mississippiense (nom. inval.)]